MGFKGKSCYEDLLGAIGKTWLMMRQRARKMLRDMDYDLTFEQLMVLHILAEQEGQNLGEIADKADRERTTISRMIDGLEKRNLVIRVPDKTDRRQKLLYLTNLGKERMVEMESLGGNFEAVMYAGVEQHEIDAALATMRKIMANLEPH